MLVYVLYSDLFKWSDMNASKNDIHTQTVRDECQSHRERLQNQVDLFLELAGECQTVKCIFS